MLNLDPKYIIAIGASAGGMEEINSFFDNTPLDGVAYVIVQHLSPVFKSRMVELLGKHSKLKVREAEDGSNVKSNEVYLIPNNKFMTIKDGKLRLTEKGNKGPHLTINTFFNSLAKDCGTKAIGVVLSGLGSDGTEGIIEIKKKGGMVMVRNPETSDFSSMPAHAVATGMVDFILEPALMPAAIEAYVDKEGKLSVESPEDQLVIPEIIKLIEQSSPHDFSGYKQSTILRRTQKRASQENFNSLQAYLEFLNENPSEVIALGKEFLISVTAFFRDPEAFDHIEKKIIPKILEKLEVREELKIWVAGCATGEEAYSLAILIAEQLTGAHKNTIVKIFATDIDTAAMAHAAKGTYSLDISKTVSQKRLDDYFTKEGENYKIKQGIRKMVIFAQHDLVKNPPYCNMHLISCRNLLIYMTPVLQKKVFNMLLFGLKMDGYLFLGSSENPTPIINSLEIADKRWKIYRNTKNKKAISFDAFAIPEYQEIKRKSIFSGEGDGKNNNNTLTDLMSNAAAREMGYLCVFVDEYNHVIRAYGDTSRYMLQENFNSNLEELLKPPLAIAFNTLRTTAIQNNERANVSAISIKNGSEVISINLSVVPIVTKNVYQKILMALFSENEHSMIGNTPIFDEKIYQDKYTQNLEQELRALKLKLNEVHDELDSSNENMQSFNEELISANEEMQSTNEEMQSVNEELHTINTEYHLKNKELLEINDDLNNYFRSNINGQLFINNELELMKFSPGAINLINLRDSDVGRPINHISTNIKFENLIEDIKNVLENDTVFAKEIETTNGRWYQMMIMPYLQQSSKTRSGAIITFSDITQLKDIQFELDEKNQSLLRINADLDHFIHAASHDLLAPLGNIETSINVMNHIALSDAKLIDVLDLINRSIKTYRLLITDIGVIAKVEHEMAVMEMVNLNEIIDNVEWSLTDKIKQSGAKIIRNLEVNELSFSRKNLRSIMFNLISNAIKFKGNEEPLINIQCQKVGKNIILKIKDNGKGIDAQGLDKIFAMYGRLNQDIEGSGIGLYLAKKIINAAGGKIVVESEPGKGSIFTIYLNSLIMD
ncbi:chemotaxis protein CheR [Pedobacter polaris]|uniref:Chemotaxis protein CheR n=1 Tax=Pedobacter polaris TaxID=2571273 RepID=A0A4U1CQX2_9SPHI|nr:chemotaxis protein CheB [Pedobacter polaris]TKC10527.1 chemotaxis protein CheR [Pedobacter polaris]